MKNYMSGCEVERTIQSLKRFFGDIGDNNSDTHTLNIKDCKILIVPLCPDDHETCNLFTWQKLFNYISKGKGNIDNINAIIFYTTEMLPRGDYVGSILNHSRMIREFFENTTYAKTANYKNIIDKIKELIVEFKLGEKKCLNQTIDDFKAIKKDINIDIESLSNEFTYQDFHAKTGHFTLRELFKLVNNQTSNDIATHFKNYISKRQNHDIASIISVNPKRFKALNILVIDDNPDTKNDLEKIIKFLPNKSKIYLTEKNEYKKFIYKRDFIEKLYEGSAQLNLSEITINETVNIKPISSISLFTNNKFIFDYVIVDLLLGSYNEGNKIIREFVKFRNIFNRNKKPNEKSLFFILVLSLSDDANDIFRAFNEESLGYVWKFNRIYSLPYLIGTLEPARQALIKGLAISDYAHARNFSKLYHLPPAILWKLRSEPFLYPLTNSLKIDDMAKDVAKNWIKQLPKAELHYHLGGSMDENIIFYLSANTVAHLCETINCNNRNGNNTLKEVLQKMNELIGHSFDNSKQDFYEKFFRKFYDCCKQLINNNGNSEEENSIKQWLSQLSNTKENTEKYIEKFKDKPAELWFDYLTYKINKDGIKISKSDLIAIFIIYAGLLEGRTIDDAVKFWSLIKEKVSKLNNISEVKQLVESSKIKKLFDSIPILGDEGINRNRNPQAKEIIKNAFQNNKPDSIKNSDNILKDLVRAPKDAKTLNQLLRGDVFFGADNLQYYENIFACVWYLMEKAIDDNVRYLEIRVAPSGYTKKNLTINEAVEALLEGADLCSLYYYTCENKFIWTNFITTAKRHKTPYERTLEIELAVTHSRRSQKTISFENNLKNNPFLPYKWKASKIVGVDLAGYEQGHPPSQFAEDFAPIFKICSFITIHAGEETPPEYIWEAIYKLRANRIGHGITIIHHPSLMELARDTQICIELCPSSNSITNNLRNDRISKYPLYKFIQEGLNVTINTDDCATTGSTLSDEFVKAAELYYFSEDNNPQNPITKWEILRLVKAGFDNAFIKREEKRELLRAVEMEIYQKILQYYEVETVYPIDKI